MLGLQDSVRVPHWSQCGMGGCNRGFGGLTLLVVIEARWYHHSWFTTVSLMQGMPVEGKKIFTYSKGDNTISLSISSQRHEGGSLR